MPPTLPPPRQAVISQIATLPKAPTLADAEAILLADLDSGLPPRATPGLGPGDLPAYRWLASAAAWKAGTPIPVPFGHGAALKEARAWKAFLEHGQGDPGALPLKLAGSRLYLWMWLRDRDRKDPLPKARRQALEDRLLDGGPETLRGWALRHALCFAVADHDLARFTELKAARRSQAPEAFTGVQALFGILGGPSPIFRLWRLPDMTYDDTTLGDLGASKVWICPPGIPVPPGAAWVIPSSNGAQSGREAELDPGMKVEAKALLPELKGRTAWFAASKQAWEAYGLEWFPILIELDGNGNLTSVRMGDAAP